jgi:hypothetical protein
LARPVSLRLFGAPLGRAMELACNQRQAAEIDPKIRLQGLAAPQLAALQAVADLGEVSTGTSLPMPASARQFLGRSHGRRDRYRAALRAPVRQYDGESQSRPHAFCALWDQGLFRRFRRSDQAVRSQPPLRDREHQPAHQSRFGRMTNGADSSARHGGRRCVSHDFGSRARRRRVTPNLLRSRSA